MRSGAGSPYWQQKGWKGCSASYCLHMSPSFPFRRAHVERGPASGVAPSRSAVATLHCGFCASSVGDLSMAVQHVPVLSPPAPSMIACCSGDMSPCNFAACTASAADRTLDCIFANAMSRARLFGGTLSATCTGAGRTISAARLSAAHGLASHTLLASFSTMTPGVIVNSASRHEQICLCGQCSRLLRMHTLERSVPERSHHHRWNQSKDTIQGVYNAQAQENARLRKADVVMLIASKSLKRSPASPGHAPPFHSSVWAAQQVGPGPHACNTAD